MGTVGWVTFVVMAALAYGCALWARSQARPRDPYHHFQCPSCRRRLRYRLRQVGHRGQCCNCRQPLIFPPLARSTR